MAKRMPGEGSIFQRKSDGRWVAALSIGGRDDRVILRRYARSRDQRKGKAEARALLEELKNRPSPTMQTVGAFLESWVRNARNIRPTTRHGYQAVVTYHLVPTIGHIPLGELTPAHVETMLATLTPTMSPKTLRNTHAVLRRALGQAVRADLVGRNVAAREFVDTPKVPIVEPKALTRSEVRALLEVSAGDRLAALFVVAVGTGLRQGELLGLAWEDLDLDRVVKDEDGNLVPAPILHVRKELVYTAAPKPANGRKRPRGRYSLEDPKTESSKRVMPLAEPVVDALRAHKQRVKAEGFVPVPTGPVFVSPEGTDLSGSWVTHHFYDLLAAAGIERHPFKILRATFSSRLYEAGVDDITIARLMGHARTHTTKRNYIADRPEAVVEAIAKLVG